MFKWIKKILKNQKINFTMGIVLGIILTATGVYATTLINSKNVVYDNSNSTLSSNNVQDSLDELYERAKNDMVTRYDIIFPTDESTTNYQDIVDNEGKRTFLKKRGNQLSCCIVTLPTKLIKSELLCLKGGINYWNENKAILNDTIAPDTTCTENFNTTNEISSINCESMIRDFNLTATNEGVVQCDARSHTACETNGTDAQCLER